MSTSEPTGIGEIEIDAFAVCRLHRHFTGKASARTLSAANVFKSKMSIRTLDVHQRGLC